MHVEFLETNRHQCPAAPACR